LISHSKMRNWLCGFLLASFAPLVLGQHSQAKCNVSSLSWTTNSLGQSPCDVAGFLQAACNPSIAVTPLGGPGLSYSPPPGIPPSQCDCSTVTYCLLMACASCQGGSMISWSLYSGNCTNGVSPDGQYPFSIPSGTSVPHWAFQSVMRTGQFNITLANSVGDSPENSTSSSTSSSSPTASGNPSNGNGSSHKSNAGVIAGGVIGGLAVVVLGCLLVYCVLRERRRRKDPASLDLLVSDVSDGSVVYQSAPTSNGPTTTTTNTSATHPDDQTQTPQLPLPARGDGAFLGAIGPDTPSTEPPPYVFPANEANGHLAPRNATAAHSGARKGLGVRND